MLQRCNDQHQHVRPSVCPYVKEMGTKAALALWSLLIFCPHVTNNLCTTGWILMKFGTGSFTKNLLIHSILAETGQQYQAWRFTFLYAWKWLGRQSMRKEVPWPFIFWHSCQKCYTLCALTNLLNMASSIYWLDGHRALLIGKKILV